MTTPKKSEIIEKAIELWRTDQLKSGSMQLAQLNPEIEELREGGYLSSAQSELMMSLERKHAEFKDYADHTENFDDFSIDVAEALQNGIYTVGSRGCGKSDLNMYVADQLMKEGIIVLVFDPSMDWLKRSNVQKYITVQPYTTISIPSESTIFDLSIITPLQQREFVERFNHALFEYQIHNGNQWYFCIYEEACQYFPQGCLRAKNMQYSVRLLTQGRNFKISMALITQFSSMVDKDCMKYMDQRFFGVTNEKNDIEYLKVFLGKNTQELKSLDNGRFFYFNKGKISKVSIEPYESNIHKQQISIPQLTPIEPLKLKTQDTAKALSSLAIAFLWFMAIIYALSAMPK